MYSYVKTKVYSTMNYKIHATVTSLLKINEFKFKKEILKLKIFIFEKSLYFRISVSLIIF